MGESALGGVKVLEYCQSVSGAYCAKQLADLGAEVIKIESPLIGDNSRKAGPFPNDIPDPEKSGLFLYVNTNKMGITLDPRLHTGRAIFSELVKSSAIVLEDNPPDFMKNISLGYGELRTLRSDIILTSITPFGQTGPYAKYKSYSLNVHQSSGLGHLTPEGYGFPDLPPLKQGKYVTDYYAGIGAALITLSALYGLGSTGSEGAHIDFSIQEWEMNLIKPKWEMYTYQGHTPNRKTVVRQGHRPIPCKDGYVAILILEEHQWIKLTELAERPEWLTDERFLDPYKRAENGEALSQVIRDWAKDYTMEEIYQRGQEQGVPVGMINKPSDLFLSQQLKERNFFVDITHPLAGRLSYPWTPYKLSEAPCELHSPAPTLGQHNEEVYCRRLGYTKQELVSLRRACII